MQKKCLPLFLTIVALLSENTSWSADWPQTIPETVSIQTKDDAGSSDYPLIESTGAGFVRKGFYWNTIEQSQGVYDFSAYDVLVQEWTSRGIRVLGTLFYNNDENVSGKEIYEDSPERAIVTEAGRQAFANFAAALADHYKNSNIIWEIWNEPNLKGFWHTGYNKSNTDEMAVEYTALVNAAVPAMKAADPYCLVVGGSISVIWSASLDWLDKCGEEGIFSSGIDGLSVHPYTEWPEKTIGDYGVLRSVMGRFGASNIPVVNSEVGFKEGGNDLTNRGVPLAEQEEYQAALFVRQNMTDQLSGIRLSNWYEWKNTEDNWGMVYYSDLSRRLAYYSAQTMTDLLAGYHFSSKISSDNPLDFLLIFENQSGDQVLIAYTAPSESFPSGSQIPQPHYVDIPLDNQSVLYDMLGNQSTVTPSGGIASVYLEAFPK